MSKLLTAGVVALSMAAMAAPSRADVFAQFSPVARASNFLWLNNGVDSNGNGWADTGTGGTFMSTANNTATTLGATSIYFTLFDNPDLTNIAAQLTFSGTATNTAATYAPGPHTYTQTQIHGGFSIIYTGASQLFGSTFVTTGSNLLSGTFHNAWIAGAGGSGGIDVAIQNGGSAHFTSAYDPLLLTAGQEEYSIHLGVQSPGIGTLTQNNGRALQSFRANGGGNFSDVVPEPASWALMIMGFGGVGAMLRNRRRVAFA